MKTTLLIYLALLLPLVSRARTWTDDQGRKIDGILSSITYAPKSADPFAPPNPGDIIMLRTAGGQFTGVMRCKLSAPDQDYLELCTIAKGSAQRLTAKIIQATKKGALVELIRIDAVPYEVRVVDIRAHTGGADQTHPETRTKQQLTVVEDMAYIVGLDVVKDDDVLDVVIWPDGFYNYQSVGDGARRVPQYSLSPPDKAISAPGEGKFGS